MFHVHQSDTQNALHGTYIILTIVVQSPVQFQRKIFAVRHLIFKFEAQTLLNKTIPM